MFENADGHPLALKAANWAHFWNHWHMYANSPYAFQGWPGYSMPGNPSPAQMNFLMSQMPRPAPVPGLESGMAPKMGMPSPMDAMKAMPMPVPGLSMPHPGAPQRPGIPPHPATFLPIMCGAEVQPQRCRRTDGKRWRCSNDCVRGHNYCEKHLNAKARRARNNRRARANREALAAAEAAAKAEAQKEAAEKEADIETTPERAASPSGDITTRDGGEHSKEDVVGATATSYEEAKGTELKQTSPCEAQQALAPVKEEEAGAKRGWSCDSSESLTDTEGPTEAGTKEKGVNSPRTVLARSMQCKRTDGKNWRCSCMAVPNHNFCEKHLAHMARSHAKRRRPTILGHDGQLKAEFGEDYAKIRSSPSTDGHTSSDHSDGVTQQYTQSPPSDAKNVDPAVHLLMMLRN
eukprot:scaffold1248_cov393-Prasinococcus_capsulatus_cf.AAC.18